MAFWLVMLFIMLVVIGASVLVGTVLNKRTGRTPKQRRQMNMAKASGAFPNRKESR